MGANAEAFRPGAPVHPTMPLIEGTDGVNKMRIARNHRGITEPLRNIRQGMSISDGLMWRYMRFYLLLTSKTEVGNGPLAG